MKVSAVIPTRNRHQSVIRLLKNFQQQTYKCIEVIIVDSSDNKDYKETLFMNFPDLPLFWMDSEPSVCIQRNMGIRASSSDWLFICDDDMELPANYLQQLVDYTEVNADCGCVSGVWLHKVGDKWVDQYPPGSFTELIWAFVFQLSLWGNIRSVKMHWLVQPFGKLILRWYSSRQNGLTLAGWPLITDLSGTVFQTSVYSLGASLVKRRWVMDSPFDEVLDPSGIGDNYGVAIRFPRKFCIHVLNEVRVYHHRASENRLGDLTAYYRRILALHYFMKRHRASPWNLGWLVWSLTGNVLFHLFHGKWDKVRATLKAITLVISGNNPYWIGSRRGAKIIQPHC